MIKYICNAIKIISVSYFKKYIFNPIVNLIVIYGNDKLIDNIYNTCKLTRTVTIDDYELEGPSAHINLNINHIPNRENEIFINNVMLVNSFNEEINITKRFILLLIIHHGFHIRDAKKYFINNIKHLKISYINADSSKYNKYIRLTDGYDEVNQKKILFGNIFN
jgi:hypothetical protein